MYHNQMPPSLGAMYQALRQRTAGGLPHGNVLQDGNASPLVYANDPNQGTPPLQPEGAGMGAIGTMGMLSPGQGVMGHQMPALHTPHQQPQMLGNPGGDVYGGGVLNQHAYSQAQLAQAVQGLLGKTRSALPQNSNLAALRARFLQLMGNQK